VVLEDIIRAFGLARGVKMLRISRLFRLIRLIRIFRVLGKFNVPPELARFFHPDMVQAFMRVGAWMITILFLNHMIACGWFGLGSSLSGIPTWVQVCKRTYLLNADDEPTLSWYYVTALHWTLTQFTPASMEVVPENTYERIFVILTILSAIIVFSSFLSSLAAAVAVFRRKREEQQINNDNLDKFFQENHVSVDLANRIQGFLRMQRTRRGAVHRIHQSAVPQLQQLSEPIKEQLAFEIFMPVISVYPMLRTITSLGKLRCCYLPWGGVPAIDVGIPRGLSHGQRMQGNVFRCGRGDCILSRLQHQAHG